MTVTRLENPYSRVNKRQAADFLGINIKTLDRWIARGCPVGRRGSMGKPWELNLLEVARWYYQNQNELRAAVPPESMCPTDRRAWYQSEILRRQLEERTAGLIAAAELESTMQDVHRIVSGTLEAIPERLAQLGLNATAVDAVRHEIEHSLEGFVENVAGVVPDLV